MRKRSNIFRAGDRIADTMLTIVDSVNPNSWSQLIVRCDCGSLPFVIAYAVAYMGTRYSCGCRRRERSNAVDYTNLTVFSKRGNFNKGRRLRVLGIDHGTQRWQYICECCAEVFFVPDGLRTDLARSLKEIASEVCPGYRPFWPVDRIEMLVSQISQLGYRLPSVALKTERVLMLSRFYDRAHLHFGADGAVDGLYGLPDRALPREWRIQKAGLDLPAQITVEQFDAFGEK